MIFVTFHGQGSGNDPIAAYNDDGSLNTAQILEGADGKLSELRGAYLVGPGVLWVASGGKSASSILSFKGSGSSYAYESTVVDYSAVDSLWHPFDFAFDGANLCYISNQDTDVVARFDVASDLLSASPAVVAPALPSGGTFLQGTFVACSQGRLPDMMSTTPVPEANGGLAVTLGIQTSKDAKKQKQKVTHSVRGVVWANGHLYVADEPGDAVKAYDAGGNYVGASNSISGPVHLLYSDPILYASSGDTIVCTSLSSGQPGTMDFVPVPLPKGVTIRQVSGMAFGTDGTFYVGSRTTNTCWTLTDFSADQGPSSATPWPEILPDNPEFLLYVADQPATPSPPESSTGNGYA